MGRMFMPGAANSSRNRSAAFCALCAAILFASAVRAQQDVNSGATFITPFPANDVYQVAIVGDVFAEGMVEGLIESFTGDARVQIDRKVRSVMGLMRPNFEERLKEIAQDILSADVAIVAAGAYDRVSLRTKDGRYGVGSDEWRAEYAKRIDSLIRLLKQKKSVIYWVGLPAVRRPNADEAVKMMNEIARERAFLNGQKYIDAYAGFADESGAYSAYGPDLAGKIRLLRDGDEFTGSGYRKLAHFVEREVKRDLTNAQNDRSIPLAGTEDEQARVNAVKTDKPKEETAPKAEEAPKPALGSGIAIASTAPSAGDQKADDGKIAFKGPNGQEATVEIVRPAISASVLSLVTRRESPDKLSQMGDTLLTELPGGLTVMNSVTPASESGSAARGRKVSPTQSPFFRVLVRGEYLAPKPGRIDDTSWPVAGGQPAAPANAPPPSAAN